MGGRIGGRGLLPVLMIDDLRDVVSGGLVLIRWGAKYCVVKIC